jgi:starch-binding outer membrane protein, SusD/RagB family
MPPRRAAVRFAFVAVSALASCTDAAAPNLPAPSIDQLTQNPTAKTVNGAVDGMFAILRANTTAAADGLGTLGREVARTGPDPRFASEWLIGPLVQGNLALDFGWVNDYAQVLTGVTILDVVPKVADYTAAQREGIRGVTKTFMAMAYVDQLRARDTFGIVLDVDPAGKQLGAFVSRDSGYARVIELLEEAKAHLNAGGSAFPFALPAGFADFNTPPAFVKFNRAIKARVEVYRQQWASALAALGESFIQTPSTGQAAALARGAFNSYLSPESNGLFEATPTNRVVVPAFLDSARKRPDGTLDLRASSKAARFSPALSLNGVTSDVKPTLYVSLQASVPVIRNEELILLRAEANIALGNAAAAIADLNYVRVNAGGLAPLPDNFAGDLVTELLYDRRYSLFFEYGHRWVDMRRYGRLTQLEKMLPTHHIFPIIPLTQVECLPRGNAPKGCVQVSGF